MRYSAGSGSQTVSVYVNGVDVVQTSLSGTSNWDTWGDESETLTLDEGSNTITYKYDQDDTGWVNLDYIIVDPTTEPTPTPTSTPTPNPDNYEAEDAALSGGAAINTDHTGYSGAGFVDGYWTQGATSTFTVSVPSQGSYDVSLRYSAGNGSQTVSVYVNGVDVVQTSLSGTPDWDTWEDAVETLTLNAGSNTIAYTYDQDDTGWINIDYISIQ